MGVPYAEVIGDPIAHSKSPLIHKFWLERLGLEGDYRSIRLSSHELSAYFESRRSDPDWRGCNVTMPYKAEVADYVDGRDEDADTIGAVNTIVKKGLTLRGYNTDTLGIRDTVPIPWSCGPNHRSNEVDLIGTGATARAALIALRGLYSEITVYGRDRLKADSLADKLGLGSRYGFSGHLDDLARPAVAYDPVYPAVKPNFSVNQRENFLVINATPCGMAGFPPLPINLDAYPADTVVYETVYDPVETPLVRAAKDRGMRVIDGLWLLVAQASYAFEHFFCAAPPREWDRELRELLTS
jgi:shikimate dehydrogenase